MKDPKLGQPWDTIDSMANMLWQALPLVWSLAFLGGLIFG